MITYPNMTEIEISVGEKHIKVRIIDPDEEKLHTINENYLVDEAAEIKTEWFIRGINAQIIARAVADCSEDVSYIDVLSAILIAPTNNHWEVNGTVIRVPAWLF